MDFFNKCALERNPLVNKEFNIDNRLDQLKREFSQKFAEMDRIHSQQIESERNVILYSWRWRIGNFQVNLILGLAHLLLVPFRFFQDWLNPDRTNTGINRISEFAIFKEDAYSGSSHKEKSDLTMACIFDTFTAFCFTPEFKIIRPTPDKWRSIFRKNSIDALFCESAWRGNNSSWRFHIGNLKGLKKNGLDKVVTFCKKKGIPTVFWNKEDPVHFTHFIEDAKQFDYVFTTDESIISNYRRYVHHDRVFSLPFAAQEQLHNPILTSPRIAGVCFAGSYYNTQYTERTYDMEILLNPARQFGLKIFDRNFGATGYDRIKYQFPEVYTPFIVGKLDYSEMVRAYKQYMVFLNVNSVKYSPTMCSRRVFELLACGTPVISTYSTALIELLGEDTVLITESEQQTMQHLEKLFTDEAFWWKQSLNGIRKVLEKHTYHHRAEYIFKKIGLEPSKTTETSFLVIASVNTVLEVTALMRMLSEQVYDNYSVLLIIDILSPLKTELIDELNINFSRSTKISCVVNCESKYLDVIGKLDFTYGAFFNPKNYYGKNYLSDFAFAITYSSSVILGKKSVFCYNLDSSITTQNKGFEFSYVDEIFFDTIIIKKYLLVQMALEMNTNREKFSLPQKQILSIDAYNYLRAGYKAYEHSPKEISSMISL